MTVDFQNSEKHWLIRKFEYTKGVIRSCKSNGQKKKKILRKNKN